MKRCDAIHKQKSTKRHDFQVNSKSYFEFAALFRIVCRYINLQMPIKTGQRDEQHSQLLFSVVGGFCIYLSLAVSTLRKNNSLKIYLGLTEEPMR